MSGQIAVFPVRIGTIERDLIYEGEDREDEYLIEGAVENVLFSEDAQNDDD